MTGPDAAADLRALRRRVNELTRNYRDDEWKAQRAREAEPPNFDTAPVLKAIPVVNLALAVMLKSAPFLIAGVALLAALWLSTRTARARRRARSLRIESIRNDLHQAQSDLQRAIADELVARYGVDLPGAAEPGCSYVAITPRGVERVQYVEVGDQPRLLRGDVELERFTSSSTHPEGPSA